MRGVAGKVLGVEFADSGCNEPLVGHKHEHDHDHEHSGTGAGGHLQATRHLTGEGGDGQAAAVSESGDDGWCVVPPSVNTTTEGQTPRCDDNLVPMWQAPALLGDLEWVKRIEDEHGEGRIHELRKAYQEYQDMGSPRPREVVPPDE
jgi:hypothetical protein